MNAAEAIKQELSTAAGFDTTKEWSQRILDALTAAGFAVVKAPQPAYTVDVLTDGSVVLNAFDPDCCELCASLTVSGDKKLIAGGLPVGEEAEK